MTRRPDVPVLFDRSRASVAACVLALALLWCTGAAVGQVDAPGGPEVPHAATHVLLKLRQGHEPFVDGRGRWRIRAVGAEPALRQPVNGSLRRHGVTGIEPLLRAAPGRAESARRIGLDRQYVLRLPAGADAAAVVADLRRHGDAVESVDLDGIGGVAEIVPDDEYFPTQYALQNVGQMVNGNPGTVDADINATDAWTITTGSSDVTLAVLDSGVNTHVELSGRLIPGWNAIFDNTDTTDSCFGHGTHVAGIAGANAGNEAGIAGVDWNARIMPVRILNGCTGFESDLANGILWAVDNGADVINMSLQYGSGSQALHDAVIYAYEAGVIMLAASGNNGFSGGVAFPGRWPETITVAATNNRDMAASFSNSGPQVDIAAPGDDIYSLTGTTGYTFRDGTSMATPHVSGLVCLMLALDPTLGIEQVRTFLHDTAVDVAAEGFDNQTGWGRIDAYAALLAVEDTLAVPGDATGDGVVDVDDVVAVILAWGPCPVEGPCSEDLDDSGTVDVDDLLLVIVNWS